MEQKVTFRDTLKSMDTEEWIDLVFYRPLGYRWALFFKKINVTPNTVTVLSILLGVAAGVFFSFTNVWLNIAGVVLLVWANVYDSADGQLARMTGNFSRIGRMLDGAAGIFWFISIYAAICWRLTPTWGVYIWVFAAATGYFHGRQAAMADYLRNFHLLFVKDKIISEFDDSAKVREEVKKRSWKNDFVKKLFLVHYQSYTSGQEQWTPRLQAFRKALTARFGDATEEFQTAFSESFRQAGKPFMKYTNILTFNTRSAALFICLFTGFPWIYFVFELSVMNFLLIYMLMKYETVCKEFTVRLRGND
jgi:hypothetical protein